MEKYFLHILDLGLQRAICEITVISVSFHCWKLVASLPKHDFVGIMWFKKL